MFTCFHTVDSQSSYLLEVVVHDSWAAEWWMAAGLQSGGWQLGCRVVDGGGVEV